MAINSRRKGARGERVAAKLLTAWTKRPFSKTPASGGLHWKNQNVAGDIVCTKEGHFFPFCMEIKNHKKIDFSHLLVPNIKSNRIDIFNFIDQASTDAERVNKIPLVMMRYNSLPREFYFMLMRYEDYQYLYSNMGLGKLLLRNSLVYWNKDMGRKLVILKSDEFFKLPYKEVKTLTKKLIKDGKRKKKGN